MNKEHTWENAHFDFRGIPTKCSNCGSEKIRYTSNAEIYHGIQFGNGYCYLCDNCGASVGVYSTKNKLPLGRFATKELKDLKMKCHRLFDPHWRSGKFRRTDCYGWLANKLGLMLRETHFGWFDEEYLLKSLEILQAKDDDIDKEIRFWCEYRNSRK